MLHSLKMTKLLSLLSLLVLCNGFSVPVGVTTDRSSVSKSFVLRMSELGKGPARPLEEVTDDEADPMEEEQIDAATRLQMEKARRADELRAQEVFMKKSTGIHKCNNCDWEYDETKGDKMMIGGMVQPGTKFEDLASNWRCPVCRASKDSFTEMVEEIPGFEVNQGYGFGTNSWTAGQKNLAIFGGLGLFFVLFLGGYALS
jgi:rubredoxin